MGRVLVTVLLFKQKLCFGGLLGMVTHNEDLWSHKHYELWLFMSKQCLTIERKGCINQSFAMQW
jgi:hypothetical protein